MNVNQEQLTLVTPYYVTKWQDSWSLQQKSYKNVYFR
jgi:hypothetical protein